MNKLYNKEIKIIQLKQKKSQIQRSAERNIPMKTRFMRNRLLVGRREKRRNQDHTSSKFKKKKKKDLTENDLQRETR